MPGMYPYGVATYGAAPIIGGDPIEVTASRLALEAIAANEFRHTEVSRAAVEVLAANDSRHLESTRLTVEVIGASFTGLDVLDEEVTRVVLEVIGGVSEVSGTHLEATRIALEAISDGSAQGQYLQLPGIYVPEVTIALRAYSPAADWRLSLGDGATGLDLRPSGVILRGSSGSVSASASPNGAVLVLRAGANLASSASLRLDGVNVPLTVAGTDLGGLILTQLGQLRDAWDQPGPQLMGLQVYNRRLSDIEVAQVEACLGL